MGRRLPIARLALTALLAGCSVLHPPLPGGPTPPPGAVVVPPDQMTLNVSNGSTLAVTLVVNDTVVAVVPPNDGLSDIAAAKLPALPWSVEVRSPTGRALVSMTVSPGAVWRMDLGGGASQLSGAGNRVDLSCGRIDVWSGPPMSGPVPGPGTPGDCAP